MIILPVARLNGTSLYYERQGTGTPIVFIHGHGLTHTMFKPQMDYFSADYQVILCDLRGNGKSGKLAQTREKIIETQGADLIMLLNELNIRAAVFVGSSYGGLIVQHIAEQYPERIQSMVVADSFCQGEAMSSDLLSKVQMAAAYCSWLTYYAPSALILPSVRLMYQQWGMAYQIIRTSLLEKRPRELYRQRLAMTRLDYSALLQRLTHPALFLVGDVTDYDVLRMKEMAEKAPHAKFEIITDAPYPSNLCQPDTFNRLLQQFLETGHNPAGSRG